MEGTLFNTEGFYLPLISTDSWLPEKSSQNGGVKEVLKPAPEAVVAPEVVAPEAVAPEVLAPDKFVTPGDVVALDTPEVEWDDDDDVDFRMPPLKLPVRLPPPLKLPVRLPPRLPVDDVIISLAGDVDESSPKGD